MEIIMINAELFNKNKLFLKFNGLRKNILPIGKQVKDEKSLTKVQNIYNLATEFLLRAFFAYELLGRMEIYNKLIVAEFHKLKDKLLLNTNRLVFETPSVREYICLFMPFMNTLFILQDRIMPIISYIAKVTFDTPETNKGRRLLERDLKSFPKYFYKKDELLSKFPENIQKIFLTYWKENAELIRSYRNFNQHTYDLLTNSFYQIKPDEKFMVILPDNPYDNAEYFRYSKNIDAFEFLRNSFRNFHFFVESMVRELGYPPEYHQNEVGFFSHIDLKRWPDDSTIGVSVVKDKAIEFGKGKGFPVDLSIHLHEYR